MCGLLSGKKETTRTNGGLHMKNMCNVINDLLPLYAESLVSNDTYEFVQDHLDECEDCRKKLENIKAEINFEKKTEIVPLKNIQKKLRRRKFELITLTVLILITAGIAVFDYLTSREYIPYSANILQVTASGRCFNDSALSGTNDGNSQNILLITFDEQVTGYDIQKSFVDNSTTATYTISAWSTRLDKLRGKGVQNAVIECHDFDNIMVFYVQNNGDTDVLLYGNSLVMDGETTTLQRLVLGYYLIIAFALTVISGIPIFIFRKKTKIRKNIEKIFFIPAAYILGHVCLKAFSVVSYTAEIDFFKIIFVSIPIYFSLIIIANLVENKIMQK